MRGSPHRHRAACGPLRGQAVRSRQRAGARRRVVRAAGSRRCPSHAAPCSRWHLPDRSELAGAARRAPCRAPVELASRSCARRSATTPTPATPRAPRSPRCGRRPSRTRRSRSQSSRKRWRGADDRQLLVAVEYLVLAYFLILNSTYLVFTVVSFSHPAPLPPARLARRPARTADARASGSALVPAHNVRGTVIANVRSLLTATYPEFEVIVVNDGSTDDTMTACCARSICSRCRRRQRPSRPSPCARSTALVFEHLILRQQNGRQERRPERGDQRLHPPRFCRSTPTRCSNRMRCCASHARSPRMTTIAAGGIVRVMNGSLVVHGEVVEARAPARRCCGQLFGVRAGAFSPADRARQDELPAHHLRRVRAVPQGSRARRGRLPTDTVCEDMELVVRLHRETRRLKQHGGSSSCPIPSAGRRSRPTGPRSPERDRWQRGLLESLWMHRTMFLNPRYGSVCIGFPFYVLFEALGPSIETACCCCRSSGSPAT